MLRLRQRRKALPTIRVNPFLNFSDFQRGKASARQNPQATVRDVRDAYKVEGVPAVLDKDLTRRQLEAIGLPAGPAPCGWDESNLGDYKCRAEPGQRAAT